MLHNIIFITKKLFIRNISAKGNQMDKFYTSDL